jgi:mannose-6-phosphate isomerase-like protein (cupin superfamily)
MSNVAPNITREFVVLKPTHESRRIEFDETLFERLGGEEFNGFKDHVLVSSFAFDADWPTWERHPAGDEIVVLIEGEAEFVYETDGGEQSVWLRKLGDYVVVPKGAWHRARNVSQPVRAFFVTPGQGTEIREA